MSEDNHTATISNINAAIDDAVDTVHAVVSSAYHASDDALEAEIMTCSCDPNKKRTNAFNAANSIMEDLGIAVEKFIAACEAIDVLIAAKREA